MLGGASERSGATQCRQLLGRVPMSEGEVLRHLHPDKAGGNLKRHLRIQVGVVHPDDVATVPEGQPEPTAQGPLGHLRRQVYGERPQVNGPAHESDRMGHIRHRDAGGGRMAPIRRLGLLGLERGRHRSAL